MVVKDKERQQRYLRDHVDPVLKPIIRRALRGSELPSDFKEWVWTQLCVDFGGEKSAQPVGTVPEAIGSLSELMGLSKPAFFKLDPTDYESTRGAFVQLCSAAKVLEAKYANDREREEQKKRAAEEARKRDEVRRLAEEARQREEKAKRAAVGIERGPSSSNQPVRLFMSYARGEQTTAFARKIKACVENQGFHVWMDEEDIKGGVNFMKAIGDAIEQSDGLIAVVSDKYVHSTYCNDELVMAKSSGLQIFPLLFRDMTFESLPSSLKFMLASINCIPFPERKSDQSCLDKLLSNIQSIFDVMPAKKQMRHANKAQPSKPSGGDSAEIPMMVPELPAHVVRRPEIIATIRSHLLKFAPASSSACIKKTEIAAHGQGGVGKTMVAAMVVNDAAIRKAYDRIGWVSMGQTANIMELQRSLYEQLTGEAIAQRNDATAEKQLKQLRSAGVGERWLVVLDDIWLPEQHRMLNCVDPVSESSVLITTRIRELIEGCKEVQLNLLTLVESVSLLLETGKVQASDAASKAAAEIAKACEYLPLYLSICGGIIAHYQHDDSWQTEVVEELQRDRIGMIEDQTGDSTVAIVVDSSLRMVDKFVCRILFALGVVPEDVWIRHAVAKLIVSIDSDVLAAGKVTLVTMRKSIKMLLDRNLLQGSVHGGFKMHDIVRELIRARLGDNLRAKQRAVVQAFITNYEAEGGWAAQSVIGQYANDALRLHMEEAMLPDPFDDTVAQSWLDAGDDGDPLNQVENVIVRSASAAFGHETVRTMGEKLEGAGELWPAAKRYYVAVLTRVSTGDIKGTAATAAEYLPVCDLLQRVKNTSSTIRTIEFVVRARIARGLVWGSATYDENTKRYLKLMEQGIVANSPEMLLTMATATLHPYMALRGYTAQTETNVNDPTVLGQIFNSDAYYKHAAYIEKAVKLVPRKDPKWLAVSWRQLCVAQAVQGRQYDRFRKAADKFAPHSLLVEFMQTFTFKEFLASQRAVGNPSVGAIWAHPATYALTVYGDIPLVRTYIQKSVDMIESGDTSLLPYVSRGATMLALPLTNPYLACAGLGDLSLRIIKALNVGFHEVKDKGPEITTNNSSYGWKGNKHCWLQLPFVVCQMRRRHWLLAPNEVTEAAILKFAQGCPAEWGSSAQGDLIDIDPATDGLLHGGGCAEMFESLGRFEEAITAAQTDIRNWQHGAPALVIESYSAIGRSEAKLGNIDKAVVAFEAAIDEAHRCELHFLEMLAHRDYIINVLDGQGKRNSQMQYLGACLSRLSLPPEQYSDVLGSGIDAVSAVAAFDLPRSCS